MSSLDATYAQTSALAKADGAKIIVGPELAGQFGKRALRYLFATTDDIIRQDQFFRWHQWLITNKFSEAQYVGKYIRWPGGGFIRFSPDGGARFASQLAAECKDSDVVDIEPPPDTFTVSLVALTRSAFHMDPSLRTTFPEAEAAIQPEALSEHHGLPNDAAQVRLLGAIFRRPTLASADLRGVGPILMIAGSVVKLAPDDDYATFSYSAQTAAGLIMIKQIWMTLAEFWLASEAKKLSVSTETLALVVDACIKSVTVDAYDSEATVSRIAVSLMCALFQVEEGNDTAGGRTINARRARSVVGTAILFAAAERTLEEAS